MKKDKLILTIMCSLICFTTLLFILDASLKIDASVEYDYDLSDNHFSFDIEQDEEKDTLDKLYEISKNEEVTIIFENKLKKRLGIFDTTNKYGDYDLFIGSYFKDYDFLKKQRKVLTLEGSNEQKDNHEEITLDHQPYEVIGHYMENYILFNGKYEVVYPLFTLDDISGKFYIECKSAEINEQIIALFNQDGYAIEVEYAQIGIGKKFAYILQDNQFKMILFVFLLSLINLVISDYSMMSRKMQKYHVHYLVGSDAKAMILKELKNTMLYYAVGIVLSIIAFCVFVSYLTYPSLSTSIISIIALLNLIVVTFVHMLLYMLFQNKGKEAKK